MPRPPAIGRFSIGLRAKSLAGFFALSSCIHLQLLLISPSVKDKEHLCIAAAFLNMQMLDVATHWNRPRISMQSACSVWGPVFVL